MRILVSPLDWGLGHATRVSALIDILKEDNEVVIAASGRGYFFLRERYPELEVIHLPGMGLRYARSRKLFYLGLAGIVIKLFVNCLIDRWKLRAVVRRYNPDLIISDNRFCFYSARARSIFLTHQLHIQVPRQLAFFNKLVQGLNRFFMKHYCSIMVPDVREKAYSLAGMLSHPQRTVPGVVYCGLLSRFRGVACEPDRHFDVVVIISGLEPWRERLVRTVARQLSVLGFKSLIVSGVVERRFAEEYDNVTVVSHLDDEQFCSYVRGARFVVVRAGYSTLMDMVALGRSALIIPTPGQTEQEYLARYLHEKRYFYSVEEAELDLSRQLVDFGRILPELERNIAFLKERAFLSGAEILKIIPV